jgi:hypothetical protein
LFLASKLEDQKFVVGVMVEKYEKIRGNEKLATESKEFRDLCKRVLDQEILILQIINFNLKVKTAALEAFEIVKYAEFQAKSKDEEARKKLMFYIQWLIRASYKTSAVIVYSPLQIALVCVDAALDCPSHQKDSTFRQFYEIPSDWILAKDSTLTTEKTHGKKIFFSKFSISLNIFSFRNIELLYRLLGRR